MMRLLGRLAARFRRDRLDHELREEIEHHIEMRREQLETEGLDRQAARREARRRFGNVGLIREDSAAWWGFPAVEILWKDVRHAVRMLARSPGVSAIAVASLAVGIGASAAIFSFANAFLFRPLHAENASELVEVFTSGFEGSRYGGSSYEDYEDFRDRGRVFRGLLAATRAHATLGHRGRPERVTGVLVSANYFDVLGLQPSRGRFFASDENRTPGTHPVVVLSHYGWQRWFGSDPDIVGRPVRLNGLPFRVVGIGPAGFSGTNLEYAVEFFVPVMMQSAVSPDAGDARDRHVRVFTILGRLRAGATMAEANAALGTLAGQLAQEHPEAWRDQSGRPRVVTVLPEGEARLARMDPGTAAWILTSVFGAVAGILGVACVNVATMLVARGATRRKEMAIRQAMGASRGRLVGQLLVECALLGGAGCALGLALAEWTALLFDRLRPPELPALDLTADYRVLAFAIGTCLLTVVVFGLAPALATTRPDVHSTLKNVERTARIRRLRFGLREGLVVVQVAASVALIAAAALLVRSLFASRFEDPGFRRDGLMLVGMDLSTANLTRQSRARLYRDAVGAVASFPGVEAVTLAALVPMDGRTWNEHITVESDGSSAPGLPDVNVVGPGYFAMMGIPLLRGREFTPLDREGAPPVAIVNEAMAERFWQGDAIGRVFRAAGRNADVRVVGVILNVRHRSFDEAPRPMVYFPADQSDVDEMTLHLQTRVPVASLETAIVGALGDVGPVAALSAPRTMTAHMEVVTMPQRAGGLAAAAAGLVELALAVMALYGVVAFAVAQRAREIALRVALGAENAAVTRLIMRDALAPAAAGIALGIALALGVAQGARSLLIGIGPADPVSYIAAAALVLVVAVAASYVPARRALGIDPNIVLKSE